MTQPKLYYFISNAHHYLISAIDKDSYGIFDLCTTRYTEDRWETLEKALEWAKKYYKPSWYYEFNTYRELFKKMLENELDFDIIDLFWDKDLIERASLHEEKSKDIQKRIFNFNW